MFWMLISCRFLFNIMTASFSFSFPVVSIVFVVHRHVELTHDVHNDAREQLALLVLVRAFLEMRSELRAGCNRFLMPSYHFWRLDSVAVDSTRWSCLVGRMKAVSAEDAHAGPETEPWKSSTSASSIAIQTPRLFYVPKRSCHNVHPSITTPRHIPSEPRSHTIKTWTSASEQRDETTDCDLLAS